MRGFSSRALVRHNGRDSGPALLNVLAAAVRANNFAFLVVDQGEDLVKEFLAVAAEEFVVGHAALHSEAGV